MATAFDADIFVLGGGPAGLATAIAAQQHGFKVVLADAKRPPIDKTCGEGLMPDSLSALRDLGVNLPADAGRPVRGIQFQNQRHCVAADFPSGPGMAVRRTVLQPVLVERAEQLGVELLWNRPVSAIDGDVIKMGEQRLRARWIVGADGSQSSIRRWAEMEWFSRNSQRFSYRRHYRMEPWSDYVEVFWGQDCQFYVSSVSADEVCVALLTRNPRIRIEEALSGVPALADRLKACQPSTTERGASAAMRRLRRVTQGNVALVGDASGTIDPITGEGLCLAFKQAFALVAALKSGNLAQYESAHHRLSRRPRFMADFMLLMDRSTLLRERSLAAFESHPHLFANLLAMHVGEWTPARFAVTATSLGWQVISA